MTRILKTMAMATITFGLSSCGSEPTEPVEQIVVREPGQAVTAAVEPSASEGIDLVAAGQAEFAACVACHSVTPDGVSGAGPNLHGVLGRAAGSLGGFSYSDAMSGAGLTWSADELEAFLADPQAKVPGTTMVAGAVPDADKRQAVIAYLASLTE